MTRPAEPDQGALPSATRLLLYRARGYVVAAHQASILNLCNRVIELERSGPRDEQELAATALSGEQSTSSGSAGG